MSTLRATVMQLLKALSTRCNSVLFLTIPAIPAHADTKELTEKLNSLIEPNCKRKGIYSIGLIAASPLAYVVILFLFLFPFRCQGFNNIKFVNWCHKLLNPDGLVNKALYEATMGPPGHRRPDLIHLNIQGQEQLRKTIDEAIN